MDELRGWKPASFALVCLGIIAFLLTGCAKKGATGQNTNAANSGFSFAVFGDSRTMMYLPSRSEQKADAVNDIVDMFELVMPKKVAKETVEKAVKLIYDPAAENSCTS